MSLAQRGVWLEADDEVVDVAFPHCGMFALLAVMHPNSNGRARGCRRSSGGRG